MHYANLIMTLHAIMFLNLFSGRFASDLPTLTSCPSSPDTNDYNVKLYTISVQFCIIWQYISNTSNCSMNVLPLQECRLATYSPNSCCVTGLLSKFCLRFISSSPSSSWTTRATHPFTDPSLLLTSN